MWIKDKIRLLEKAFVKASSLSVADQDILAQPLLVDLAELSKLADEALAEHKAGRTRLLEEIL